MLVAWAMREADSRGRRYPEPPHPYRGEFARDRDRIIHARAFRRLEAKTQVFTTRYSDHFRDRLTHTLEVTQIARTVAGAMGLNVDFAEALALVHDIGHPPFGHAGERRLDALLRGYGGRFDHNLHALRIVEQFEQRFPAHPGLNLTFEVREGIIKHSRDYSSQKFPELSEYLLDQTPPLEAQLIDRADEIAYNTADLDDAMEADLLDLDRLSREVPLFAAVFSEVLRRYPEAQTKSQFNETLKRVVDYLVTDLITASACAVREHGISTLADVRSAPLRLAQFSPTTAAEIAALRKFLFLHVYNHPSITEDRDRSVQCLDELFVFYMGKVGSMPSAHEALTASSPRHVVVCDYIAGMTDQFLLKQHRENIAA
jgi:dGTPase